MELSMARDKMTAIREYVSETTVEMDTEEYIAFMSVLGDWCHERAEMAGWSEREEDNE